MCRPESYVLWAPLYILRCFWLLWSSQCVHRIYSHSSAFQPALPRGSRYLIGLSAIISSRLFSLLFRSSSVFFSLSGTRRSFDCKSLVTSCSSASDGKVLWQTGQQGSWSSVSWLINCVYTAVAPASMALNRRENNNSKWHALELNRSTFEVSFFNRKTKHPPNFKNDLQGCATVTRGAPCTFPLCNCE